MRAGLPEVKRSTKNMKTTFTFILSLLAFTSYTMAEETIDLNGNIDLKNPEKVEERINLLIKHLGDMRSKSKPLEVKDYKFKTTNGETSLSKLFGTRSKLLVIHNMGKDCNYCTLWADGFNGILPHINNAMEVVLTSTDSPKEQAAFAKSRGWNFEMASHKDLPYTKEQTTEGKWSDSPGASVYEKIDGKIYLKNKCFFDPGDIYCSMWSLLGLAGMEHDEWQPKTEYKTKK